MYTVADVLNPDFSRSWPEAVALVREIAGAVGSSSVPAPQDLLLDESGGLALGFASESAQHPVTGLAWILSGLLDGIDAPPQLRALAAENLGASPAHKTVEAFSSALAFFERPERKNELRAIVRRLGAARTADEANAELELQRLKEKVGGAPPPADAPAKPAVKAKRFVLTRRQRIIAAAVGTAAATVVLMAIVWSRLPSVSVSAAVGAGQQQVSSIVAGGLRRLGLSSDAAGTATASAPAPKPARTPAARIEKQTAPADPRPRKGRDVILPARRSAAVETPRTTPAKSTSVKGGDMRFVGDVLIASGQPIARLNPVKNDLTRAISINAVPPSATDAPKVYSSKDRQVEPARLLRPQLPHEPPPGSETGYFVVTVDEQGTVEQVRLISPMHRYHDRMLVAAAKAWRFQPARLNGESVRYELRIPIILKGMP